MQESMKSSTPPTTGKDGRYHGVCKASTPQGIGIFVGFRNPKWQYFQSPHISRQCVCGGGEQGGGEVTMTPVLIDIISTEWPSIHINRFLTTEFPAHMLQSPVEQVTFLTDLKALCTTCQAKPTLADGAMMVNRTSLHVCLSWCTATTQCYTEIAGSVLSFHVKSLITFCH